MTLTFRPLSLDHKDEIETLLRQHPPQISELTFTNLFIWRCYYRFQVAEARGLLYLLARPLGAHPYFFPPVGKGDLGTWLENCLEYFKQEGFPPRFERLPSEVVRAFAGHAGLTVVPDRDNSDYVYATKNLIKLSGNRYHTPKNHINRFTKRHVWEYQVLTPDLIKECLRVQEEWCLSRKCSESHGLINEDRAITEALTHLDRLSYRGGVIRVAGKVEAFTLGERLNPETVVIHIEKTNPELPGLNPLIQQQFLKHEWAHLPWVNREQDLGIEGLRKSKMSYHPEFFVEKFRLLPGFLID